MACPLPCSPQRSSLSWPSLSSLQVTAFVMNSVTQTAPALRTRKSGPVLKGPAPGLEVALLIQLLSPIPHPRL